MKVVALVVNWNSAGQLAGCVAGLDAQDHPDLEVVVVDNASSDGSDAVLVELEARPRNHPLRVLRNATNRGFAGGINDGLAATDAEAVLFCNVDVDLAPDLVSRCVAVLVADQSVGSVQPKLLRTVPAPDGQPVVDTTGHVLTSARLFRNRGEGERDEGRYEQPGEVFGVSGALALHRRAMLDDVAWQRADGTREVLTEDLFAYFDDVELDWRARLLGWRAWYEPSAVGRHERGGSGVRRTPTVEALNWGNRLVTIATCDDGRALLRATPLVAATTLLKTVELAVTVPSALVPAVRRLTLLPAAGRRRRELLARARVPPGAVVVRWVEPFRWRPWIATWWQRATRRSLGVARR